MEDVGLTLLLPLKPTFVGRLRGQVCKMLKALSGTTDRRIFFILVRIGTIIR
jgi:hypothetical protein